MNDIPLRVAVRSKLPQQLEAAGYQCRSRATEGREKTTAMRVALQQAVQEYLANPRLEILVEINELTRALAQEGGSSPEELEALRKATLEKEGDFDQGLILDAVTLRPEFVTIPREEGEDETEEEEESGTEEALDGEEPRAARGAMPWE